MGRSVLPLVALAASLSSTSARGQAAAPARPLAPEALFASRPLTFGARVSLSADGRYVAYVTGDPVGTRSDSDFVTTRGHWSLFPTGAPFGTQPGMRVWVLDLVTQREVAVGGRAGVSWGPAWSPTGDRLAFLSDRDGRTRLWLWRPATRSLTRVTAAPLSTDYYGALHWTADGRVILLSSPPRADLDEAVRGHRSSKLGLAADSPSVEVRRSGLPSFARESTGDSTRGAGGGAAGAGAEVTSAFPQSEIVAVDVSTGHRAVLVRDVSIGWLQPSPDGRLVAYAAIRDYSKPQGQRYQAYYDLLTVPLSGGAPRRIASDLPLNFYGKNIVRWAPDSRGLAYSTVGLASQHGLFRVSVDGSGSVPLEQYAAFTDTSVGLAQGVVWDWAAGLIYGWSGPAVWRYDPATGHGQEIARLAGKRIWHLVTRGQQDQLYLRNATTVVAIALDDSGSVAGFYGIDVTSGRVTPLYQGSRQIGTSAGFGAENTTTVSLGQGSSGERIVFAAEAASEPQELWAADPEFHDVHRISHLAGPVLDTPLGERRIVQWTTTDERPQRGIVLLPVGYQPGTRYPLIVWMYERAIPYSVNTFGLSGQEFFNLHLFATRGYASFYPDLTWAPESVMSSLGEQVHSAVQELSRLGIADSTRVGVVGQSSGGYDVLAIAATCPWVRAGVAASGIADMVMAFGSTMDDPVGYEWVERQMGLGAPPWEHPERYVANSPSYHFDKVGAALLLLEGAADAFTVTHMDLAFAELKRLGKPVEYRRYPREGHVPDLWAPANRLDAERRMLEWWAFYLKPDK
jgi:dipeptidyl aminopeptidase/acylaminoacyl peptidase